MANSMNRDVLQTSGLALLGRSLGFLIPFFIAALFGVDHETDAFFLAFGMVFLVQMILGNVFEIAIVPYITSERAKGGDIHAFLGGILARATLILAGVVLVLLYVACPVIYAFAGLGQVTRELHFKILLEMTPMIFFMAWTSALNGAFHAEKHFHIPALSPAIRSGVAILSIFAFQSKLGIHAIAWGFTVGEGLRFVVSLLFYLKKSGSIRFQWALTGSAKPFLKSALYQTIAFAAISSLGVINQTMSGSLGAGELSIYSYGERLRNVPSLLFFTGILPVVFSHWANDFSRNAENLAWEKVRGTILKWTFGGALLAAIAILFKDPITWVAFHWRQFPEAKLQPVSVVFAIMMAAIPFDILGLLCSRLLIIYHRDRFYMIFALVRVILTVGVIYALMNAYALMAIPLGFAIVSAVYSFWLYYSVGRMFNRVKT